MEKERLCCVDGWFYYPDDITLPTRFCYQIVEISVSTLEYHITIVFRNNRRVCHKFVIPKGYVENSGYEDATEFIDESIERAINARY